MRFYLILPLAALLIGCSSDTPEAPQDAPPAEAKPAAVEESSAAPAEGEQAAAQPDTKFQPADPDEPSPGDAEPVAAEEPSAPPPEGEQAAETMAQQAEPEAEPAMIPPESEPLPDDELSLSYEADPTYVRVAVLNTSGRARGAGLIAFLLEDYRKKHLERKIGKLITVVNQSSVSGVRLNNSVISYRPGNLRAALIMADVIPGRQYVAPMIPENTVKIAVDVEIRVGRELP